MIKRMEWEELMKDKKDAKRQYGFLWDIYRFFASIEPETGCEKYKDIDKVLVEAEVNISDKLEKCKRACDYFVQMQDQVVDLSAKGLEKKVKHAALRGGQIDYYKKYMKYKRKYMYVKK